jgi:hypothetical protein
VKVGEKASTQLGPLEREFFGIQNDGKSQEKFCESCTTYTIVRILSSLSGAYKFNAIIKQQ